MLSHLNPKYSSEELAMVGVYAIIHRESGNLYIGSTSVSFSSRWRGHRCQLRKNMHHSPYLQNAWNKYGESAFDFIILDPCSIDIVISKEQYYIDELKPVYNICPIASSTKGRPITDDHRKNLSKAQKKRWAELSDEDRKHSFATVELLRKKQIEMMQSSTMRKRISDKIKQRWENDPTTFGNAVEAMHAPDAQARANEKKRLYQRPTEANTKARVLACSRHYAGFVAPDGTEYRNIFNLAEFCRQHNINDAHMTEVYNGRRKQHKGWKALSASGQRKEQDNGSSSKVQG